MAKPDKPLLSIGAKGTIADSFTFQKRGKHTIARKKPAPKDPRSAEQLAQRQKYSDAVALWNDLSPEEKEAWRGAYPGLTTYQGFMRYQLLKVPPGPPIDIGSPAIERPFNTVPGWTSVDKNNPANHTGIINIIEFFVARTCRSLIVGTLYLTDGNTLKCRASQPIPGEFPARIKHVVAVNIAVAEGDYIGFYEGSGYLRRDLVGFAGIWTTPGEFIDPGDEATYDFQDGGVISLYGIGEGAS